MCTHALEFTQLAATCDGINRFFFIQSPLGTFLWRQAMIGPLTTHEVCKGPSKLCTTGLISFILSTYIFVLIVMLVSHSTQASILF